MSSKRRVGALRTLFLVLSVTGGALLSSAAAQALVPAGALVRVLLSRSHEVVVTAAGPHRGSVDGMPRFTTPAELSWPVTARSGLLLVDGREVGRRLLIEMEEGTLSVAGRSYRGGISLIADGDEVEVINVLDIEAYLRGVVPSEMSATWPLEALKAQAVAARSYTMTSLDPMADYDLCATVDCQVYRGVEAEHPRTNQAVAETAGIVVSYAGLTARTYYHADSGGTVASSSEVWGTPRPYLLAITDVAASSPHRGWQTRLDGAAVGRYLSQAGINTGTVTGLRVVRLSESGRVLEMEVTGQRARVILRGSLLREQARGWGLKSMRFRVQGGLTVSGDGWGHGVGMSQYGARALALSGYDYGRILAFYYPNTGLTRFVANTP